MIIYAPCHYYIDINSDYSYQEEDIDYESMFENREMAEVVCKGLNDLIIHGERHRMHTEAVIKADRYNQGVDRHNYLVQGGFESGLRERKPIPSIEEFEYTPTRESYKGIWEVVELRVH